MSRKPRVLKQTIFIACEGHTELYYFGAVREIVNVSPTYAVRVELLELTGGTRQDPLGLVQTAKLINDEEDYDEVWVVFDKDRDRNTAVQEAFEFASANNIHVAYSSIAFEHWILLHFEKNNTPFERSDCESRGDVCQCNGQRCVVTYLRQQHYPNYQKGSVRLYGTVAPLNMDAIENAAWLKFRNRHSLGPHQEIHHPYTLNPHTDVDHLLTRLLELDNVVYSEIGVPCEIGQLAIAVTGFQNATVTVSITNNSQTTFVVNNMGDIKLKDAAGNLYAHSVTAAVQIAPTQTKTADLIFNTQNADIRQFRFTLNKTTLLIALP